MMIFLCFDSQREANALSRIMCLMTIRLDALKALVKIYLFFCINELLTFIRKGKGSYKRFANISAPQIQSSDFDTRRNFCKRFYKTLHYHYNDRLI